MSTQTLDSALAEKIAHTFELVDQRNSQYHMKGTENMPNPISLRASKFNQITLTSEMCLGKNKGYAKTQYVPNAPVIHIEDMWRDAKGMLHSKAEKQESGWEEVKGLKSLGYNLERELKLAKDLKIGFKFGLLSLDQYGNDPTLHTFIMNHHCHVDRPNAKEDTKLHSGLFKFRCVKEEEKAAIELKDMDSEMDALVLVASLRTRTKTGFEYTEYNKAKIDAIIRLMNIQHGAQPSEYTKKLLMLKQYAEGDSAQFMDFIKDSFNAYRVQIGKAVSFGVLSIKDKAVHIHTKGADKKTDSRLVMKLESTDNDEQMEELAVFFVGDAGITTYKEMLNLIAINAKA